MVQISKRTLFLNSMIVVAIFTMAYYIANRVETRLAMVDEITGEKIKQRSLFDAFYFTLITQTTVGYGNFYAPSKVTQMINVVQLFTIYKVIEMAIL